MLQLLEENPKVKALVVGIGNVGNDAIHPMLNEDICEMKFVHISVEESDKLSIWTSSNMDKGVVTENKIECQELMKDVDMVFIVCDMDSEKKIQVFSDVAQFSKEQGILTVGMFAVLSECKIKNSLFQINEVLNEEKDGCLVETENSGCSIRSSTKMMITMNKNNDWKKYVDILFVVPFQDLSVIFQGIKGIVDTMNESALIQLDFADIRTIMKDKGLACIGIGRAKGSDKGIEGAKNVFMHNPFLKASLFDAKMIMVSVIGDISIIEANDAVSYIDELTNGKDILFSMRYEETLADEIMVMYIATGNETLCINL